MTRAAHANCTRGKEYPDGYGLHYHLLMTGFGSGHIFIHDKQTNGMGQQERENTPFGLLGFYLLLRRELTHRYDTPVLFVLVLFLDFFFLSWDWHIPQPIWWLDDNGRFLTNHFLNGPGSLFFCNMLLSCMAFRGLSDMDDTCFFLRIARQSWNAIWMGCILMEEEMQGVVMERKGDHISEDASTWYSDEW